MDDARQTRESDTTALRDCETLIARIDGTLAALTRERARLEARARTLARTGAVRGGQAQDHGS
jgi:hypothetical protein